MIFKTTKSNLKLCITRYGNVLASRGSLLTVFNMVNSKKPVTITDPGMTDLLLLNEAIDLVFYAFKYGKNETYFEKNSICNSRHI